MRAEDLVDAMRAPHMAGIFVGGSTAWKLRTAPYWARVAREHGLLCHVGRVGTARRVRAMRQIGVGSIDSALPLFEASKWRLFWGELRPTQRDLFHETDLQT